MLNNALRSLGLVVFTSVVIIAGDTAQDRAMENEAPPLLEAMSMVGNLFNANEKPPMGEIA